MKIGIDCRLWNETGVGRYIRNLVKHLLELDEKNDYVLFVKSDDQESIKNQVVKIQRCKFIVADIRWHSVEEQAKFPHILNKENLDFMHFPYFSVPVLYKRPFVITVHDLIINNFNTGKATTLPQPIYLIKRAGYNYVLSQAVKNARKIIVPLDTVKKDIIQAFHIESNKIIVTPEGVDESLTTRAEILDTHITNYFLYVGNAYPHKNLERLIEAFVLFRKETDDDVQLVFVGKLDYFYTQLHDKVKSEGFQKVYFKHGIPDSELAWLYAHAIAFVSPSLMEGFGLPPLEAMASSSPIVLADIPAFKEVCGDVGFYFNPYVVQEIKEKLQFIYNLDKKAKQEHIERGLERVKQFSWGKMAKQTLEVYESSTSV